MTDAVDVRTFDLADAADLRHRAAELVPCFKALADEHRLAIMLLLATGPHTVRELTDATGLAQTLVSHHLAALREVGLVTSTARGRANLYRLCCDQLAGPVRLLASLATLTPEGSQACCAEPT
jgi:DNA-binding transcriptional ArsR family regulator